jgi:hypothetical protein
VGAGRTEMAKKISEHLFEEIFKSERVSEYSSIRCYPLFVIVISLI